MNNIIIKPFNIKITDSSYYNNPLEKRYALNDLGSVYTHYDPKLGINVPTENKLKEVTNNGNENT